MTSWTRFSSARAWGARSSALAASYSARCCRRGKQSARVRQERACVAARAPRNDAYRQRRRPLTAAPSVVNAAPPHDDTPRAPLVPAAPVPMGTSMDKWIRRSARAGCAEGGQGLYLVVSRHGGGNPGLVLCIHLPQPVQLGFSGRDLLVQPHDDGRRSLRLSCERFRRAPTQGLGGGELGEGGRGTGSAAACGPGDCRAPCPSRALLAAAPFSSPASSRYCLRLLKKLRNFMDQ